MKIVPMSVELLDQMGDDLTVVNAARVSMHKESEFEVPVGTSEQVLSDRDAKLIKYLAEHNHWTPFGHCFAQFRIKAPIFVARQLVKHQVGLVWNEVSRRYVDEEPEFWLPEVWRGRPEGSIKQGSAGEVDRFTTGEGGFITAGVAEWVCRDAVKAYSRMIEGGVAPEMARMILPQNMMTEWIWSGSLAAWGRVCKLRLDPHAQKETEEVAVHIDRHMANLFPVSWKELMK